MLSDTCKNHPVLAGALLALALVPVLSAHAGLFSYQPVEYKYGIVIPIGPDMSGEACARFLDQYEKDHGNGSYGCEYGMK